MVGGPTGAGGITKNTGGIVNCQKIALTFTLCTGPLCPCKVRRHVIVPMSHCFTRESLNIQI